MVAHTPLGADNMSQPETAADEHLPTAPGTLANPLEYYSSTESDSDLCSLEGNSLSLPSSSLASQTTFQLPSNKSDRRTPTTSALRRTWDSKTRSFEYLHTHKTESSTRLRAVRDVARRTPQSAKSLMEIKNAAGAIEHKLTALHNEISKSHEPTSTKRTPTQPRRWSKQDKTV